MTGEIAVIAGRRPGHRRLPIPGRPVTAVVAAGRGGQRRRMPGAGGDRDDSLAGEHPEVYAATGTLELTVKSVA